MSCADVFSDRLMAGAVLHALLENGGEQWQAEVTNVQREYERTKAVPDFDQLSLQLHTHEENLRISNPEQPQDEEPSLKALYTPAMENKRRGKRRSRRRCKGENKGRKDKGKDKEEETDSESDNENRAPVECFNCGGPHYVRNCPNVENYANLTLTPRDLGEGRTLLHQRHY
ncbi:MAG: hypothetical protein GY813_03205, partial [Halieaceae bacterium]|nr:hypothetical protein [Halieaceae bacterium]